MRRRLVVAVVAIVTGALLLAGVGTFVVVRHIQSSSARRDLAIEARSFASVAQRLAAANSAASQHPLTIPRPQVLALVRAAARLANARLVVVTRAGQTLPRSPVHIDPSTMRRLWAGTPLSGGSGNLVYAAQPIGRLRVLRQDRSLGMVRLAVVLARAEAPPAVGIGYLAAVSGAILLVSALAAAKFAGSVVRPIDQAVATTRRIADGDLAARMDTASPSYPEVLSLAGSINAMASALARSKGLERQFLLSVSHDLRTPLTSIRGFAEAIAEGAAPDPRRAGEVVSMEARRLERLVQDLLELARLDARQFSFNPREADVAAVLAQTAEGQRIAMEEAGLELSVEVNGGSCWAYLDPDRLAQMLANLLQNAFKFAQAKVVARCQMSGPKILLVIADDGPGIPEEDLVHVFERLYTSERPAARQGGTGLGLAIVAELASAMGIAVSARSPTEAGHGTAIILAIASLSGGRKARISEEALGGPKTLRT